MFTLQNGLQVWTKSLPYICGNIKQAISDRTKADSPTPNEDYFIMYNRWNLPLKHGFQTTVGAEHIPHSTCVCLKHTVMSDSDLKCYELWSSFFYLKTQVNW